VHPCTGRTAHRESRGIALLFLDHGTRRGRRGSVAPQQFFTPRKDPVPIVQEAVWAPRSVWTGVENLAPTGIRSPSSPDRSQSLYRLSYPANFNKVAPSKLDKSVSRLDENGNTWISGFVICDNLSCLPKYHEETVCKIPDFMNLHVTYSEKRKLSEFYVFCTVRCNIIVQYNYTI